MEFGSFDELHEEQSGRLRWRLGVCITSGLKALLETKHLYQSLEIGYGSLLTELPEVIEELHDIIGSEIRKAVDSAWMVSDNADRTPPLHVTHVISFSTPDVKLFCTTCGRSEAFNSISSADLSSRGFLGSEFEDSNGTIQVFAFSFQCQSCKGAPEVFLVRRRGNRLALSGRAPIEHVDVPAAIPRTLHRWYSGAVVAHQSGQTLAGLFLLRVLIEQWTLEATGASDLSADQVIEAYMEGLACDFKARFPSLRELYGKLSNDIHRAEGSPDLYEEASSCIREHFEARRLYRLGGS